MPYTTELQQKVYVTVMYYFCNALLPTLSKRCSRLFTATYKLRNKGPLSASVVPRRTFSGKMFFTLRKIVILITFLT